jgi:hypothetical protein
VKKIKKLEKEISDLKIKRDELSETFSKNT